MLTPTKAHFTEAANSIIEDKAVLNFLKASPPLFRTQYLKDKCQSTVS